MMLRSGGAASLSRASHRYASCTGARTISSLTYTSTLQKHKSRFIAVQNPNPLALVAHKPFTTSLQRYATHPGGPFDKIDKKHEEEVEYEKIVPHPEEVSATSSVHEVFHEKGIEEVEKDEDMLAGVKADLVGFFSSRPLGKALMSRVAANYKGNLCSR